MIFKNHHIFLIYIYYIYIYMYIPCLYLLQDCYTWTPEFSKILLVPDRGSSLGHAFAYCWSLGMDCEESEPCVVGRRPPLWQS